MTTNTAPATRDQQRSTMSQMLAALGFETMAREVLAEEDPRTLDRYAGIVLKQMGRTLDWRERMRLGTMMRQIGLNP